MATEQEQIPLNEFKLVAVELASGSNTIYNNTVKNLSAIVLSAQIANITNSDKTVSVRVLTSGSTTPITVLKDYIIPPNESLNPFTGKVVLQRYDGLYFITSTSASLHAVLSVLENAND